MISKPKNKMYLISSPLHNHPSIDTVFALEGELSKLPNWEIKKAYSKLLSKILMKIFKADYFLKFIRSNKKYFVVVMNINAIPDRCFPFIYFRAKKKVMYLFDAWEPLFPKIKKVLNQLKIDMVFIQAKQSAEILSEELKNIKFYWIPEGLDVHNYYHADFKNKDIDVIQFGRKYDLYHEKIVKYCSKSYTNYLYAKVTGEIVFKKKEELINALSRSKISICFPSSITHIERTGKISTLTKRYLESMACKCLIVGKMPDDMRHLFDYNPIIEADLNNPETQLKDILENYDRYFPLIEKNYLEVQKHHWKNRVHDMKKILEREFGGN